MNLLIDIGNSRIKWKLDAEGVACQVRAFAYTHDNFSHELEESGLCDQKTKIENIYISNVAGSEIKFKIMQWCSDFMHIEPKFATSQKEAHGLFNAYIKPEQLGVDRYLAMLGAKSITREPFVVVDCGTAVTIDSVNTEKKFIGGVILPGLRLMCRSLSNSTDALVYSDNSKVYTALALDTQSGIESGSVLAITSAIESAVKRLSVIEGLALNDDKGIRENDLKKNVRCIISGGDGKIICEHLSIEAEYQEDLVLKGLLVYFQAG